MSGSLPRYERRVGLASVPVADAVAPELARASALSLLSRSFEQLGDRLDREMQPRRNMEADRESASVELRDSEGRITLPDLRGGTAEHDVRYDRALSLRVGAEFQLDNRARAVELRQQVGGDEQKFRALWQGHVDGALSQVPDSWRDVATSALTELGDQHYGNMLDLRQQRNERNAVNAWSRAIDQDAGDLARMAQSGRMGGPQYNDTWARMEARYRDGVAAGHISAEEVELRLNEARATSTAYGIARVIEGRGLGVEASVKALHAELGNIRGLPPREANAIEGLLRSNLHQRAAAASVARSENRSQAQDVLARQAHGVDVRPEEFRAVADRARRLGDSGLAEAMVRQADIAQIVSAHRALPPDMLEAQAARLRGGPEASRTDAEAATRLDQVAAAKREALRRDPLGEGVRHLPEDAGRLAPIPWGNTGQAAEVLRQRIGQAALVAESQGVAAPVLTRAEVGQVRGIMETAPIEQQLMIISALTRGLGDEGALQAHALIQPSADARDMRNAWAAAGAAEVAGQPELAMSILQGTMFMRENRIPALSGNAPILALNEHLRGLLPHEDGKTRAAIGAGMLAAYAADTARDHTLAEKFDADHARRTLERMLPTVTWNAVRIPAPRRGVDVADFAEIIRALPDEAMAGAQAADGSPFTADMLRRGGRLVGVGPGRYRVMWGGHEVVGPGRRPFVLDLSQATVPEPRRIGAIPRERQVRRIEGWDAE